MELKQSRKNYLFFLRKVLIVPYGIETGKLRLKLIEEEVLIVPYGIET